MKPEKLNSLIALVTPIVLSSVTAFQPQIKTFLGQNSWIPVVASTLIAIWNNISEPIHK